MSKMMEKTTETSLEMTASNHFFMDMLDKIDSDVKSGVDWKHENEGEDYLRIFSESYDMKSQKEKEMIAAYNEREVKA